MAEVKAENEHGGEQRNERARSRSPIRDERKGGSGGNKRGPPGSGRSGGGGGGRGAGDPHPRRVFVSNIPYDVKWQDLKDAFKKHVGDVSYVEIYEDEKGRSRGMGVIEFRDSGMVEKAIDVMNRHEIKDRKLVVKYDFETLDRGERRGGAPGASPGGMRGAPMGRDHREDRGPPPGRRPPGSSRWGDEVPPPPMRGAPVHPVDPSEKFGNTFGLSISFLESLGIDCPLTKRVFVVNLSYNVDETKLRDIFRLAGNVQHVELFKDTDGKSRGRAAIEFEHPVEAVQAISMFNNQELYDRRMRVHMGKMKEEDDRPPRLPEGLKGIGMGLGDNGAPLRDVRSNLPKMTAPPAAPPQAPPPAAGLPPAPAPAAATTPATAALNAVLQTLSAAGGLGALPGTNALQGLLSKLGSGAPGISGPSPDLASQLGLNTQAALNLLQSQLGGQQGAGGAAPPTSLASSVGLRGSGNGLDMNNGAPGVPSLQSSRGRGGTSLTGLAGPPDLPPVSLAGSGPRGAHLPPERNLGVVGGDTVIVRNLPASISWQDLRELFREAGDVKYAEKRTPSEGVVRFSNDREAERAINLFDRTRIQGQAIDVIAFNTRR